MPRAAIYVSGAHAELKGVSNETLETVLAFDHPAPYRSRAFMDGRWDGKLRLYRGARFPGGLALQVAEHIADTGRDAVVHGWEPKHEHDWSWLRKDYLPPVGKFHSLWDHQHEAIHAALNSSRGIIKLPTGAGKTEIVAAVARALRDEFAWRSLVLVPRKGLLHQTAKRLCMYYQDEVSVGVVGDGKREVEADVVVATAQTLQRWKPGKHKGKIRPAERELRDLVKNVDVLFLDECHRASSDTWYEIAMNATKAKRRYGLSGTPLKNSDIDDAKLVGATGPILYEADVDVLINAGLAAKPKIAMVMSHAATGTDISKHVEQVALAERHERVREKNPKAKLPKKPEKKDVYQVAYRQGVVENDDHNAAVVRATQWLVRKKRRVLVLCRLKAHFHELERRLQEAGVNHLAVWGDSDLSDREHAKRSLASGTTHAVLATTIWDEGEDLECDAIVLAEGVKAITNTLQRIGRGMRRDSKDVWVVDFVPTCHGMLNEQAAQRADAYESEGYEVVLVEDWPARDDEPVPLPFERWDEAVVEE